MDFLNKMILNLKLDYYLNVRDSSIKKMRLAEDDRSRAYWNKKSKYATKKIQDILIEMVNI